MAPNQQKSSMLNCFGSSTRGKWWYRLGSLWYGWDTRSWLNGASKLSNRYLAVQDLRSSQPQSSEVAGNCME